MYINAILLFTRISFFNYLSMDAFLESFGLPSACVVPLTIWVNRYVIESFVQCPGTLLCLGLVELDIKQSGKKLHNKLEGESNCMLATHMENAY